MTTRLLFETLANPFAHRFVGIGNGYQNGTFQKLGNITTLPGMSKRCNMSFSKCEDLIPADNYTYSIDLTSSWTNDSVTLHQISKTAPVLNTEALWLDSSGDTFCTYADRCNPLPIFEWLVIDLRRSLWLRHESQARLKYLLTPSL